MMLGCCWGVSAEPVMARPCSPPCCQAAHLCQVPMGVQHPKLGWVFPHLASGRAARFDTRVCKQAPSRVEEVPGSPSVPAFWAASACETQARAVEMAVGEAAS